VHKDHNEKDRTVLEVRAEGDRKEPWTWVRTQGQGRVFYTAWGHDQRTWGNLGFQALVERGIRWAVGRDPSVVPTVAAAPAPPPPLLGAAAPGRGDAAHPQGPKPVGRRGWGKEPPFPPAERAGGRAAGADERDAEAGPAGGVAEAPERPEGVPHGAVRV